MPEHRNGIAERFVANSAKHGRDLRQVNESLRELISSLEQQRGRLAAGIRGDARPPPAAIPPRPEGHAMGGGAERDRLWSELARARAEAEQGAAEHAKLLRRLADIEEDNRRACEEYAALQQRTMEVMQLYVTLERLHGGSSPADALQALQEIVVNVLGSEEFALFEARGDGLEPSLAFGVEAASLRPVRLGSGALGRAGEGRAFVASRDAASALAPEEAGLTLALPLRAGNAVVAVLAVFRLLPQKPALSEADLEVLSLLEAHAGKALGLSPRPAAAA